MALFFLFPFPHLKSIHQMLLHVESVKTKLIDYSRESMLDSCTIHLMPDSVFLYIIFFFSLALSSMCTWWQCVTHTVQPLNVNVSRELKKKLLFLNVNRFLSAVQSMYCVKCMNF